jgi:VWFA-related protein
MKRCLACFAVTLLLNSGTGITAQDNALQTKPAAAPDDQKIKVRTDLMEVRTIVTDRDGRIIENLKKEDFELLENDQPQEISFFSVSQVEGPQGKPVATGAAGQGKTPEVKGVQERLGELPVRTTLLYVDTLHLSFTSLNSVKQALRRFINERLTEQDMVALAASGQTLGIAQQFTRDRQILNYAIEQIRLGPVSQESFFTPELAASILAGRQDALRLATSIVSQENSTDCCDILINLARSHALQILSESSASRAAMLGTLRGFAEQMIDLPGKRMIVVFSDGFTMRDSQGDIYNSEIQSVTNRAARSGVVIYSIDARGLQSPATVNAGLRMPTYTADIWPSVNYMVEYCRQTDEAGAPDPKCHPCGYAKPNPLCAFSPDPGQLSYFVNSFEREKLNGLHAIAEETGGKMFTDTNDLNGALGRAFDANRYYYVLSYYLPTVRDSRKFRSIKVRVRNHPEYTIQTARGFALSDLTAKMEAVKTPQRRLLQAMNAPLPVTDLGVSARADFLETESDDKQVSLTVYFDGDRFQYKDEEQHNTFKLEILYVIYDSSGKQEEGVSAYVEGNLSPDRLTQAKTSGYRFSRRLTLKPGVYQVRVGVREEETDRMGTATAWVQVPELAQDKLEMSSLILSNPLDIEPAEAEGIDVSKLEQIRMVHCIPLFERGDFFDYSFRVYVGTLNPVEPNLEWMPELYRDGRLIKPGQWLPVSAEKEDIDSKGWFDVYGEVGIGEFSSGVYELRVNVRDSRSNKTAQRTAVFSVE